MSRDDALSPFFPTTSEERVQMQSAIGINSIEELFQDIPPPLRLPSLNLPPPLSELELLADLRTLGAQNADISQYSCFLGGGAYHHFIPSVVRRIISRGEFSTAYTPYQPEVSQGTLQAIYEFQTLTCLLFDMECANSGMYDGATALAEAALMACRISQRNRIMILDTLAPLYRQVVETYALSQGLQIETVPSGTSGLPPDAACLLVQQPNFYGYLEDVDRLSHMAHRQDALLAMSVNPITLGVLRSPGSYDADIAVAEGQPLGVPLSYGGPYVGLFACRQRFLRQMPGRIVGQTSDTMGRPGYVLTLQTREQHIRRERATSNICTSEALIGLAVTSYLAALGPKGLRQVGYLCYDKAHYLASCIANIHGYNLPLDGPFFNEFVVQCPLSPREINSRLLEQGIIGGLDITEQIPQGLLLCVTEMNTRQQLDSLVEVLRSLS